MPPETTPSQPGGPDPGAPSSPPGSPPPPRGRVRARCALLAAVVAAGPAVGLWAWLVEPNRLEVTHHDVRSSSPVTSSITVVHLTDVHVRGDVRDPGSIEARAVAAVAAARPDLVVITGDTVDGHGEAELDAPAVTAFLRAVADLRPPLGTWAVRGNHELWSGEAADRCYAEAGVPLLDDATRSLQGGRLVLHGLNDGHPPATPLATPGFDLILCHYPAVLPRVAWPGVELVLAGHSHGGQVNLPGGKPLWLPYECGGFLAGWYDHERGTRMYVSRGVGTSILPLRFLCRPEVAVLRIWLP
jgi:predicted MPP superfamily phosphohydrolase